MPKRGRRIGQTVNPRDEQGWMIPRDGTTRRRVYDLLVKGKSVLKIHKALGLSYAACTMHKRHIVKTDRVNALQYNASHPDDPVTIPGPVTYKANSERETAVMIAKIIQDEIGGEICTPEWAQAAADRIVCALGQRQDDGK